MNDPIADMLTRIRNAILRGSRDVMLPSSNINTNILKVLKEKGYIKEFEIEGGNVKILLKYKKGISKISGIKRVSKPSLRVYTSYKKIPRVLNGLGMSILSTPEGIVSDDIARKKKIGGEIICRVW
jgi:small subunit ribosomal protein S8